MAQAFPCLTGVFYPNMTRICITGPDSLPGATQRGLRTEKVAELEARACGRTCLFNTLRALHHSPLTHIHLHNTLMTRKEYGILRRTIEGRRGLRTLALSPLITDHNLPDDMVEVRRLLRSLGRKESLEALTLTAMRSDLLNWKNSPVALQTIASLPNLRELELVRILPLGVDVTDLARALMAAGAPLKRLTLAHCRIRDRREGGAVLEIPTLRHVRYEHIQAPADVVMRLLPPHLHTLALSHACHPRDTQAFLVSVSMHVKSEALTCVEATVPEIRLTALTALLALLANAPRVHTLTLGGMTTSLTTSSLCGRFLHPRFLPALRRLRIAGSAPDSFVLQIVHLLQHQRNNASCVFLP